MITGFILCSIFSFCLVSYVVSYTATLRLRTTGVKNEHTLYRNDLEREDIENQGSSTDTWSEKLSVAPCEEYDLVGCSNGLKQENLFLLTKCDPDLMCFLFFFQSYSLEHSRITLS